MGRSSAAARACLWAGATCLILNVACGVQDEAAGLAREVNRVRRAMTPADARDLELAPKLQEALSVTWEWRFTTAVPAARYRAELIRDLTPPYACLEQHRRVLCSRRFPGDRIQLDVRATPSNEVTAVQVRLMATAD